VRQKAVASLPYGSTLLVTSGASTVMIRTVSCLPTMRTMKVSQSMTRRIAAACSYAELAGVARRRGTTDVRERRRIVAGVVRGL